MANNELQKYMKSISREVGIEMKSVLCSPPRPKKPYKLKQPHPLALIKQKNKRLAQLGYMKNPTREMYSEIVNEILQIKKQVRKR